MIVHRASRRETFTNLSRGSRIELGGENAWEPQPVLSAFGMTFTPA
jgi:hypothetical protein